MRGARHRTQARFVLAAFALLLALTLLGRWIWNKTHPEPTHAGRTLTYWFDRAGGLSHPQSNPEVRAAFTAMEGDTLPFLLREIRRDSAALRQPGQVAREFRTLLRRFGMEGRVTASVPGERARTALILAAIVAKAQRSRWSHDHASPKPSVAKLFPVLLAILSTPSSPWDDQGLAVQVLCEGGPLFADQASVFIKRVADGHVSPRLVARAMPVLGMAGTNTTLPLTRIFEDTRQPEVVRAAAATVLAGQAARNLEFDPAVLERVRAAFLRPNSPLDEYLVCSFARAGTEPGPDQSWVVQLLDTPLSADLPAMASRSRPRALVALWRRFPEEQQLDQAIRTALTSADPGGVLTALSETEVSPASFGPELQALKTHHDGRIRYLANLLLARLETERAPSATSQARFDHMGRAAAPEEVAP